MEKFMEKFSDLQIMEAAIKYGLDVQGENASRQEQ